MTFRPQLRVLAVAAAAWLLAACSARNPADATGTAPVNTTLHARAAQRIVLPGAEADATASAATIRRALPEAPEVIRLPDGTVGVKVAAQYYDTVVACRQPDGSFGTQCPHSRERQP